MIIVTHSYIHNIKVILDMHTTSGMYRWSALSVEYGSTGYGCQSRSWSAEQGKIYFFLSPYAPENLVSRDRFDRPIPRQPAHSPHSD